MSQCVTGNAASNLVLAIDQMTEMIFGDYYRISVAIDVDCHDESDPQIPDLAEKWQYGSVKKVFLLG